MIRRATILAVLAAIAASLVTATAASAKTVKLFVTPTYKFVDACLPGDGQVRVRFRMGAKFERVNSNYPKSVKLTYKVWSEDGAPIGSGSVKLKKKSGWKQVTKAFTAASGTTIDFKIKGEFRSPNTGRLVSGTSSHSFAFSSQETLIANGIIGCGAG